MSLLKLNYITYFIRYSRTSRAAQISWATVNQWLTNVGQRLANFVLPGFLLIILFYLKNRIAFLVT